MAFLWAPVCAGCALSSKAAAHSFLLSSGPGAPHSMAEGLLPRRSVSSPTPWGQASCHLCLQQEDEYPLPHPRLNCERGSRGVSLSASYLVMFYLPKMQWVCAGLLLSRPLCVCVCVCGGGGSGALELLFHFNMYSLP